MTHTRGFAHAPQSVTGARRFVGEVLAEASDDVRDLVTLMVSELASNCIRHTHSGFDLAVSSGPAEIRVEATDLADGAPRMRAAGPTATDGRGLQIIDMFASSWGYDALPKGGKTVWFTLSAQVAY